MAKRGAKSKVSYWNRNGGGYWTTIDGRQIELARGPDDAPNGPTFAAARAKFASLAVAPLTEAKEEVTIGEVFDKFHAHLKEKTDPRTKERETEWARMVSTFRELFGQLRVVDLRVYHFDQWFTSLNGSCGDSSKAAMGAKVVAAINWAVKRGYIDLNPVKGKLSLPEPRLRGREAAMTEELCLLIIALAFSKEFNLFLRVMHATGCRPIELSQAKACHYNKGRLVFPWNPAPGEYKHKTAKTKKDRVIYLPHELQEEVEALVKRYPTGPIFRSPRGKKWRRELIFGCWKKTLNRPALVKYLRDHDIKREDCLPYHYRHTFATNWCDSGRSIMMLAQLIGNSVTTIEKFYCHSDLNKLHEALISFHEERHQ